MMRYVACFLVCLLLTGCALKYAWNVDSKGTKTITLTVDEAGAEGTD